jgi:hypothetical protein
MFTKSASTPSGFRPDCKPCCKVRSEKYRKEMSEERKQAYRDQRRKRYTENKEKEIAQVKQYRAINEEKYKDIQKRWYIENKESITQYRAAYSKNRRNTDPVFKLAHNLRVRLRHFALRGFKSKKTQELLGCSFEFLRSHLEQKFENGMSWENYGSWHIDHIVPLAIAESEEQLQNLFHYSNLQPLWAQENREKGARIDYVKPSQL